MIKYKRPSGSIIEVGDTDGNRATAEKFGWVLVGSETAEKVDKTNRVRRTKAEMKAARQAEDNEDF